MDLLKLLGKVFAYSAITMLGLTSVAKAQPNVPTQSEAPGCQLEEWINTPRKSDEGTWPPSWRAAWASKDRPVVGIGIMWGRESKNPVSVAEKYFRSEFAKMGILVEIYSALVSGAGAKIDFFIDGFPCSDRAMNTKTSLKTTFSSRESISQIPEVAATFAKRHSDRILRH